MEDHEKLNQFMYLFRWRLHKNGISQNLSHNYADVFEMYKVFLRYKY